MSGATNPFVLSAVEGRCPVVRASTSLSTNGALWDARG